MIAFKKYWQIIYAALLIVLVPILIVVNTLYAVRGFKEDTDVALQRQALIVGRLFNVAAQESLDDPVKLQEIVEDVSGQIGEVRALEVLVPDGSTLPSERFRIVAGLDTTAVGKTSSQVQNVLAWTQDEAFAFLTRADSPSSADEEVPRASGKRYWGVIMPLVDGGGQKRALVFMKISLETLDARVAATLFRSYILLALTVLVTVPLSVAVTVAVPSVRPATGMVTLVRPDGTITLAGTSRIVALLVVSGTVVSLTCAALMESVRLPVAP